MPALGRLRLGVNIDHIATLRNAGGGAVPDPLRAALLAEAAGADGIATRLAPDRRDGQQQDIAALMAGVSIPLTLCVPASRAGCDLALAHAPHAVGLIPDAAPDAEVLAPLVADLRAAGLRVILSIAADPALVDMAAQIGAQAVTLDTGRYAHLHTAGDPAAQAGLAALRETARAAVARGLEVQMGGGLAYDTAAAVAAIPELSQVTVGHFLIGEAIFRGLGPAIEEMRRRLNAAREGWA